MARQWSAASLRIALLGVFCVPYALWAIYRARDDWAACSRRLALAQVPRENAVRGWTLQRKLAAIVCLAKLSDFRRECLTVELTTQHAQLGVPG